ncbi:MAG: FAD-dependent oxidoreductase, partial [Erythrobacter sp.]|nr:FAD-dependent oxidoreductase [Erythrobacter sp.]
MKFTHDVIVIGAGAAGLTAAGGCALFGLEVALIEGGEMGGECLNNGCVPSKALITAAKRAAEAREGKRFGVQIASPQIDWSGVHSHIQGAIAAIAPHDSQERFEEMGCEVIRGWARLTGKHTVEVGGRKLSAPRIVIATGSRPFVPPIEGLDAVPYLTNENLFELESRPDHLVIIGGGVIGMEMAQSFVRLGAQVTVIEPERPMGRDDAESVEIVVDVMKAEGVRFVEGKAKRVESRNDEVRVHVDN